MSLSTYTIRVSIAFFHVLFFIILASTSPVAVPSPDQSSPGALPTLNVTAPRPPKKPICPEVMSPKPPRTRWFAQNCEEAIKMIPRDIRPASPLRNFYLQTQDQSQTMPNVALPFEREYGDCVVQLLMASSFMDVPHERAAWMDIWGPSRLILQQCIIPKNAGGIVTHIGEAGKLDLAIYSKRSLFALNRRLRASRDPVATSIAEHEFLQLLGLAPGILEESQVGGGNGTVTTLDAEASGILAGNEVGATPSVEAATGGDTATA